MNKSIFSFFFVLISVSLMAQNKTDNTGTLPYYQIPESPKEFTAANVAARMVDGLGFRYYWATEGLREEDLSFRPNEEARTTNETLNHILGLSNIIVNSVLKEPNIRSEEEEPVLSFEEKRRKTLENIKTTSDILRKSTKEDMEEFKIVFKNGDNVTEYPFWNQINGPIEDAIWHTGQVVSFRRSSGNPFNSKASVLRGRLRD